MLNSVHIVSNIYPTLMTTKIEQLNKESLSILLRINSWGPTELKHHFYSSPFNDCQHLIFLICEESNEKFSHGH